MSKFTSLRRTQAIRAATTSPVLRDFRHLDSVPRWWLRRGGFNEPSIKVVKQKDRIKYWNIVPGDQVRVLGDREGMIREVLSVNRFSNRVSLRGDAAVQDENKAARNVTVHYSRCQLFIGKHEFPPSEGSAENQVLPVFATRLSTSKAVWNKLKYQYEWKRFAVNTAPRLPYWSKETHTVNDRVQIPWPEKEKPEKAAPTDYETKADVVTEITYKPTPIIPRLLEPVPRSFVQAKQERKYLNSILNIGAPHEETAAMEVHVEQELSPAHSRAKKQKRWQEFRAYKRQLLQDYIKMEMTPQRLQKHKSSKEARAWAVFKWREKIEEMRKVEKRRRWINRGAQAELLRKQVRKAKKAEREERRLQEMSLALSDNQVIPEGVPLSAKGGAPRRARV